VELKLFCETGANALHWANLIESFRIKFVWGVLHLPHIWGHIKGKVDANICPDWNQNQDQKPRPIPRPRPNQLEARPIHSNVSKVKEGDCRSRRWICLFTFWGCIIGYLSSNLT